MKVVVEDKLNLPTGLFFMQKSHQLPAAGTQHCSHGFLPLVLLGWVF